MKLWVWLSFFLILSGCASTPPIVLTSELTQPSSGACEDISPIPEQILSMTPVLDSAIESGEKLKNNASVLVIFDIDNTLLATKNLLGSDQWFTLKEEQGVDFNCLLDAQKLLYQAGSMRPTHKSIPKVVNSLIEKGFRVAVLTSRGPQVQAVTLRDLFANSLRFDKASPEAWIYETNYEYRNGRREIEYEQGVFLTSGVHKGEMAQYLIEQTKLTNDIKKVIFVDDKAKHVCRVQNSIHNMGIEVESFHYPVEDYRVKPVREKDQRTLAFLSTEWQKFFTGLNCRTKHCEEALNRCKTQWEAY